MTMSSAESSSEASGSPSPSRGNGGSSVRFTVNGEAITANRGASIAAALLADGRRVLRVTERRGEPRGLFCGMGVCFECLVEVDGRGSVRACRTLVADGIRVRIPRSRGAKP